MKRIATWHPRLLSLGLLLVLVAPAGVARSTESGSIAIDTAEPNGGIATVTGRAALPEPVGPQDLEGRKDYGAVNTPVDAALGVEIEKAEIEPLADGTGLRFIITVGDLPEQVLPEVILYFWWFTVDGRSYAVEAKRTGLIGDAVVADPEGSLDRTTAGEPFMELQGPCDFGETPSCPHAAFLDGEIDVVNGRISMLVPFEHQDDSGRTIAEGIEPGAAIRFDDYGWGLVGAEINDPLLIPTPRVMLRGARTYFIGPQVHLGFGSEHRAPDTVVYTSRASLNPDGTFAGTVSGRIGVRSTVFARICNGVRCIYDRLTLPYGPDQGGDPGDALIRKSENVTRLARIPYTGGTEVDFDGERYLYAGQWDGTLGRGEIPEQGGIRVIDLEGDEAVGVAPFSAVGILDCPGTDNYVRHLDPEVYNTEAGDRKFVVVAFHENVCTAPLLRTDPNTSVFVTGFNGIMTVDVTDPVRPEIADAIGHDSAHTVKPHPTRPYIYVLPGGIANGTTAGGDRTRLSPTGIIDASDPTNLLYVRAFEHNATGCHDFGFTADGRWGFCAGQGEVQTWDLSDPEAPRVAGTIVNPAIQFAHNAVVSPDGRYLVINDEAYGVHTCNHENADVFGSLWIYDIADPRAPVPVGRIAPPGHPASDAMVLDWADLWCTAHNYNFVPGTNIIVASWFAGGTTVHDISDPLAPRELAFYQPSDGVAWSAHYYGGYVVTNDMMRGLEILEIPELRDAERSAGSGSVSTVTAGGAARDRTAELLPPDLPRHPAEGRAAGGDIAFACFPGYRGTRRP